MKEEKKREKKVPRIFCFDHWSTKTKKKLKKILKNTTKEKLQFCIRRR